MVSETDCRPGGEQFESSCDFETQWLARRIADREVSGSNPASLSEKCYRGAMSRGLSSPILGDPVAQWIVRRIADRAVQIQLVTVSRVIGERWAGACPRQFQVIP